MKKIKRLIIALCFMLALAGATCVFAQSDKDEDKIKKGVKIDSIDVGGMTASEAKKAVKKAVKNKISANVSITVNDEIINTSLEDLGYEWANEEVVDEAVGFGMSGNIIKRYKDNQDLENKGQKYEITMDLNKEKLEAALKDLFSKYSVEAKNASLKATGHGFEIIKEKDGVEVDYEKTVNDIYKYVNEKWDGKSDFEATATTKVSKAKYTTADCEKVSNEPMGSFTTTFSTGTAYNNRNANIENGASKIDGAVLYPGEQFSCNEHLVPWTEDNGWKPAGTYVDGGVADSLGGGICQVSSTLYNALLRAEIKVVTRYSHSMAVSYVDLAADAALAGDYKDLVFENDTDAPIYIQGVYNPGGSITFNVYGHDTRPASHSVKYESELVSTTPIKTKVTKDSSKPKGYLEVTDNGHVGYVAKLWKITYEDGKEVSKELLHTSTYRMSPKKVIKGTGKADKKEKETTKKEKETTKKEKETTKKSDDE